MAWVKFNSHRAREKAARVIELPKEHYSFDRHYHLWPVKPEDESKIKNIKGVTILKRLPDCEWSECW